MALQKDVVTRSGAPASYWRITEVKFRLRARVVSFVLAGYLNKQARDADREPQMLERFDMEIAEGVAPETLTREVLYKFAKEWRPFPVADAPFADATDA